MKSSVTLQLLERLAHLHQARLREFAYQLGLHLRQFESLLYLNRCNRYSDTPLALAEYLGLTKGTVSQTIIALENKGLLRKAGDEGDGRLVHLKLTSKAEKLLAQGVATSPLDTVLTEQADMSSKLGKVLMNFLIEVQRENKAKTFGVCQTCTHFHRNGLGAAHRCGLTNEALSDNDSTKICREHCG